MENLTETKTKEKAKVYSPETLQAINRHLRQGDLAQIAISSNMSYAHVRRLMTGNRGICICRNVNSQRVVEEALVLLVLRKSEAIEKRDLILEQIKVARAEASALQIAISEMENLLQPQPQQNN